MNSSAFSTSTNATAKTSKSPDPRRLIHLYAFVVFFLGAFIFQAIRVTKVDNRPDIVSSTSSATSNNSNPFFGTLSPLVSTFPSFSKIVECTELHDGSQCYVKYSDDLRLETIAEYDVNVSNKSEACFQTSLDNNNDIYLLLALQSCINQAVVILDNLPETVAVNESGAPMYAYNSNHLKSASNFFLSIRSLIYILISISLVNSWSLYHIAKYLRLFKYNFIILKHKLSHLSNDLNIRINKSIKITGTLKNQVLGALKDNYEQVNQCFKSIIDDHMKLIEELKTSLCNSSVEREISQKEIKEEHIIISDSDSNTSVTESSSKSHILQVSSPLEDECEHGKNAYSSMPKSNVNSKVKNGTALSNRIVLGDISSSISPVALQNNYKYLHQTLNSQASFPHLRGVYQNSINRTTSPLIMDSSNQDKTIKVVIDEREFNLNTIEGRLQWSEYMISKKESLKLQNSISHGAISSASAVVGGNSDSVAATGTLTQENKSAPVLVNNNKIIESIFINKEDDNKENISLEDYQQLDLVRKAVEVLNKPVDKISDLELRNIRFAIKLSEFNKISTVDKNGKQLRRILIPGVGWRSSKFFKRLNDAFNA